MPAPEPGASSRVLLGPGRACEMPIKSGSSIGKQASDLGRVLSGVCHDRAELGPLVYSARRSAACEDAIGSWGLIGAAGLRRIARKRVCSEPLAMLPYEDMSGASVLRIFIRRVYRCLARSVTTGTRAALAAGCAPRRFKVGASASSRSKTGGCWRSLR